MTEATVRVVPIGPERYAYVPLFHLADDSVEQVLGYYQTGTLFALDAPTGETDRHRARVRRTRRAPSS